MSEMTRTHVYIDGFNLYYGCLKGTPYRWLDVAELCRLALPTNDVLRINYYTAHVGPRPNNPDQPIRQRVYLRALRTIPTLSIHLGHYFRTRSRCPWRLLVSVVLDSRPSSRPKRRDQT